MMGFRGVMIVARTESKLFARSWLFRFLMFFTVVILGFLSWGLFISGEGGWMIRSMPSSLPYFLSLMLAIFETLIVIFGAVESVQRDRRLNTFESLHTRNITNLGYVTGKVIGVLMPGLILNAVFILAAIVADVFFISDIAYSWQSYIAYPFLLTLPALLFVAGVSLFVAGLVRSTPLALAIMVGYFALTFFFRGGIFARLIDFNAMHEPLLSSSIVGFGDPGSILLQRAVFLFLGIGSILAAGLVFQRLPQSLALKRFARIAVPACVAIAALSGTFFVSGITRGMHLRERVAALNDAYVTRPRARMTACDLDIIHDGASLDIEAALTLYNHKKTAMNSVILSLNPGFTVRSVRAGSRVLPFTRHTQIIEVPLPSPLEPGDETVLTVAYDGTIDDDACYPDIDPAERIGTNRVFTYVIDRQYGFVTGDYVLLTPECIWYPVSGIPCGLVFPEADERDFTAYTLDVTTRDDLTAISQGAIEQTGVGRFAIRPEVKLPSLSLAIGDYEKRSVEVDGVEVALYNLKGNFFFRLSVPFDPEAAAEGLKGMKDNYEIKKQMQYPYPRYCVVESPVQFHAYERPWKTYTEISQPQIAIMPERGFYISMLSDTRFDVGPQLKSYEQQIARQVAQNPAMQGNVNLPTASSLQSNMMRSYLYDILMSDYSQREMTRERRTRKPPLFNLKSLLNMESSYVLGSTISVQYYPYLTSFESERYPVFNTMMEFYRKHGLNTNTNIADRQSNPLYDEEIACMALQDASFEDYLKEGTDFDTMNLLLMLKSNHLFGSLQAAIGNSTEFDEFLNDYTVSHAFENVSYEQFAAAVEERFALNMDDIFETWFSESRLPMFEVSDVSLTEFVDGEYTYYHTRLKVTNTEPVPGTMWVQVRLSGIYNAIERETRFVTLAGHQTKEVGFITDAPPPDMEVNYLISQNLPIIYQKALGTPRQDSTIEPFEGERMVSYSPNTPEPGTIVVDNLDAGFELVSDPANIDDGTHASIYRYGEFPNDFITSVFSNPPKRWGKAVVKTAYGTQKIALYTRGGSGDGKVKWSAEIPEAGQYDLEYYMYDPEQESIGNNGMRRASAAIITIVNGVAVLADEKAPSLMEDYHLTVTNGGETSDITFMPHEDQPGWQYVSTMELAAGEADVCLCNKSEGKLIYADAVRWVRK